jgi:hypothetical protein
MNNNSWFEMFFWGALCILIALIVVNMKCAPMPDENYGVYIGCLQPGDCKGNTKCDKSAGGLSGICREVK